MNEQEIYITEQDTTIKVFPAAKQEQRLCFSDEKSPEETACVGHLRGDYGRGGKSFHTSWWPHQNTLKTNEFIFEFDNVVNALKKTKLLGGVEEMRRTCCRCPEARIHTQFREEYAFRVETKDHTYYLRCIPTQGDYNFYLYAYRNDSLREIHRAACGLPQWSYTTLKSTGEAVEIRYGENGFHPITQENAKGLSGKELADSLNKKMGISKAQIAAMETGSIFGWHTPGANAKNYNENGLPLKPKSQGQER